MSNAALMERLHAYLAQQLGTEVAAVVESARVLQRPWSNAQKKLLLLVQ